MDIVFYFDFLLEDEHGNIDPSVVKGFVVTNVEVSEERLLELINPERYILENRHNAVHDWSSSPCDDVLGVGYTTYELEEAQIDALMEDWRAVFSRLFPESTVSKVVEVEGLGFDIDLGTDSEIHNAILNKLKE